MARLASAFLSIRARCPNKVKRRDLMMDESGGWLVMRRMTVFLQRMSRIMIRYDTGCYFNVRSKANMSQLTLPHGTDN